MTEFEMAYLMNDVQSAVMTSTTTLFSITSAFLLAGYAAGHKLNRTTVAAVIIVFTWAFATTAFITSRQIINLLGLVGQIHDYAAAGKGLQWHAAAGPIIEWAYRGGPTLFIVFCVLVFGASIAFFFHCRRQNRRAETGAWHPRV